MKKYYIYIAAGVLLLIILLLIILGLRGKDKDDSSKQQGSYPTENFTLTYWGTQEEASVFKPIIENYQENHPNATIKYIQKKISSYESELINAMAEGNGPDIFEIKNDWLPKHKNKITPAPLDIFNKNYIEENFYSVVSSDFVENDKVYAVPHCIETFALIENIGLKQKRVDEIAERTDDADYISKLSNDPKTWNDFVYQAKHLTLKKGVYIDTPTIAMGTSNNTNISEDILYLLMLQNKTKMVSDDLKTPEFNLPITKSDGKEYYAGTAALSFDASFADPKKETYSWSTKMPNALNWFINGKLIYMFAYPDTIEYILQKNPSLKISVIKTPQVAGTDQEMYYANYWGATVNKDSKNSYAAWDFIQFINSTNAGAELYMSATNRNAANKALNFRASNSNVQNYAVFNEQLTNSVSWYKGIYPEKVDATFKKMITNVNNGQTSQRAIDAAAKTIRSYLQINQATQ
ncbi:MAG: extracellular solute-binding protein [Patescibacteria group bacterium]|nr:extracellular solute-binding protein [Patescibacteria group bacterium]